MRENCLKHSKHPIKLKLDQKGPTVQKKYSSLPTTREKKKEEDSAAAVINFTLETLSIPAPSTGHFLADLIYRLDTEQRNKCV